MNCPVLLTAEELVIKRTFSSGVAEDAIRVRLRGMDRGPVKLGGLRALFSALLQMF